METQTFFSGSNRRVILGSPTLQTTSRRVSIPIRMPLSGEAFTGMPDWIGTAYTAVSKYLTEASPDVQQISDVTLGFYNDKPTGELFAPPSAKVPASELKNFSVTRVGDPDEDPEVELQFKAFIPFSRDFWGWIGEMAGKEVYMAFPSTLGGTVTVKPTTKSLPLDDDNSENDDGMGDETEAMTETSDIPEDPSLEDEFGPEYEDQVRQSMGAPEPFGDKPRLVDARPGRDRKPRKSGPKELKDYHAKQSEIESKAKRGARKSLAVN
jgi:hypothetical protein